MLHFEHIHLKCTPWAHFRFLHVTTPLLLDIYIYVEQESKPTAEY